MEKPGTSTSYFQNLFNKVKIGNLVTQSVFGNYRDFTTEESVRNIMKMKDMSSLRHNTGGN
jgi:hypothetical protein